VAHGAILLRDPSVRPGNAVFACQLEKNLCKPWLLCYSSPPSRQGAAKTTGLYLLQREGKRRSGTSSPYFFAIGN
jgi:hypothetical protein